MPHLSLHTADADTLASPKPGTPAPEDRSRQPGADSVLAPLLFAIGDLAQMLR
jgi:hypothetical protein